MAIGTLAAIGGGVQAGASLLDMLRKMQGRKLPGAVRDPMAGLFPAARQRIGQELTGQPDPTLARVRGEAVRAPIVEATRAAMDNAPTPGLAAEARERGSMRAATELAQDRGALYSDAAKSASSAARTMAGRSERGLGRETDRRLLTYGQPTGAQRGLGGLAGGLGDFSTILTKMQELKESGKKPTGGGVWGFLQKYLAGRGK